MSQAYAKHIAAVGDVEELRSMSAGDRRLEVIQDVGDVSMTRQEFSDECDINQIMARFERDGVAHTNALREPVYLDCTAIPADLQGALNLVKSAEEAFMTLTAEVRRQFDNDPVAFVDYASNPENLEQMRKWGLARPVQGPPEPVRVEVVTPAAGESPAAGGAAKPAQ